MNKKILFWLIIAILLTSCKSITSYFPKEPRPFQKREFNSAEWKNGDYQIRGEMINGDLIGRIYKIDANNSQDQITELLGKPDKFTKAACCYAGRSGRSGEKDLWIYYIEVDGKTNANDKPLVKKALKIYFDGTRVQPNIGDRDGDHSFFPAIG